MRPKITVDEINEIMDDLESMFYKTQNYPAMDKYRDFRAIFQGNEQGRRVYREILKWAGIYRAIPARKDSTEIEIQFALGERNMGLRMIAAINVEPQQVKPVKTIRTKPEYEH